MRRAAALLVLAVAMPSAARGDAGAAEGRFFHERGAEAYARRRYGDAVGRFLTAYRASPNPRALYNVATAAFRAHEDALAFTSFEEYLASDDDDAERRAEATRRRDELGARLAVVHVVTDPPGATLYVGRRERGIAARSPARLPLVDAGEVRVIAELDGHRRVEGVVQVVLGATAELSMRLPARSGRLEIATEPAGADVVITREGSTDAVSLGAAGELEVGAYQVRVTATGHRPRTVDVVVRADAVARAEVTLEPLPRVMGRLLVDGAPGARVRVDGRLVGVTPLAVPLPVGQHEVVVERGGLRRDVVVTADRPVFIEAR
ncbi:MAG: PEGA domain-containing protein [Sandaracinaceae bacterium]|nr:PEGA domain-containing protein [Sandaracinaceae bacterium]